MNTDENFANLPELAADLRKKLDGKKTILLFAYNGTGKTRLSMDFKDIGRDGDEHDTLYFNAFTEDLFHWNNDLIGDTDRRLLLNQDSRFFQSLFELEMDTRIRPLLQRYVDFDFRIDTQSDELAVRFSRQVNGEIIDNIKVSRGEERIFIWCLFLVVVELAMDPNIETYRWVRYLYIDDPVSSLDEHNAIAVADHLAQLLKRQDNQLKTVISTHHTLFFNVLCNGMRKTLNYVLSARPNSAEYLLRREYGDTPVFHHVAALVELYEASQEDRLFTHHFNMLRTILEKTATFHGYENFSACIAQGSEDPDGTLHARLVNILSHGKYSLYEPKQMLEENKQHFKNILHNFLRNYPFNPKLFPQSATAISEGKI